MIYLFLDKRHKEQASPQYRLPTGVYSTRANVKRAQTENSSWPNMLDAAHEARDWSGLQGQGLRLELEGSSSSLYSTTQTPSSGC